jgi:hypothetical protein
MNPDDLTQGAVPVYPYLWFRQRSLGETKGRKTRPTAIAFRMGHVVALIPTPKRHPGRHDLARNPRDRKKARPSSTLQAANG